MDGVKAHLLEQRTINKSFPIRIYASQQHLFLDKNYTLVPAAVMYNGGTTDRALENQCFSKRRRKPARTPAREPEQHPREPSSGRICIRGFNLSASIHVNMNTMSSASVMRLIALVITGSPVDVAEWGTVCDARHMS
ncbi:hypothetical protein EDD21DRAFT_350197 [Dissophora ornata]|nr:hypothetical protein EDD21DRAFT_350197 [Dissophora ornata]